MITPSGTLHQFVPEDRYSWHSGINQFTQDLYNQGPEQWKKYRRYVSGVHYPESAVYLDGNMNALSNRVGAKLVKQASGEPWSDYEYFDARWGANALPLGYTPGIYNNPNHRSIGIELLGKGKDTKNSNEYTNCLLYTSPSPRDQRGSRMPSSA